MLLSRIVRSLALLLVCSAGLLLGQTSLSLASGAASAGGTVTLNLNLTTADQPAALQWTLSYSNASVASVSVAAGAAAIAAGKTVSCAAAAQSTACLLSGTNAAIVSSGVAATVTVRLTATASGTVAISVVNTLGARPDGMSTAVSGAGGSIAIQSSSGTSGTAAFLTADYTTSGSWKGVYGADGANVVGDTPNVPNYVTVTPSGAAPYVWTASTADPRAPQTTGSTNRVAAVWYSPGVFTVDLPFTDTAVHRVAIYLLDWDGGRSERIDVVDSNNNPLDSRTASNFQAGQYLVWNLSGHVILRFTNTGAYNAVVSGIFFGGGAATQTNSTATFVKSDTSTSGSWTGIYGADGSNVIGDSATYPSYVTVTPAGFAGYVWNGSTADPRALKKHAPATDRVAGTWYSPTSFTVDLNFHDTNMHRVAFYLLDWDGVNSRAERIDILDANNNVLDTRTATAFSNGLYLVWNLSSHVIVRFTNMGAYNAVLNGMFFDGGSPASGSTAVFLRTDTTTSGSWKGVYGADGFNLEADGVNYPAYVTATPPNTWTYTWTPSTTDPRALQQASGVSRLAACWYTTGSFTFDLSFTDSNIHQVALYVLDWDGNNSRAETIDFLDVNNNILASHTATAFSSGQYLVWNVTGHVVVRVTNTTNFNAVLSGLFFR